MRFWGFICLKNLLWALSPAQQQTWRQKEKLLSSDEISNLGSECPKRGLPASTSKKTQKPELLCSPETRQLWSIFPKKALWKPLVTSTPNYNWQQEKDKVFVLKHNQTFRQNFLHQKALNAFTNFSNKTKGKQDTFLGEEKSSHWWASVWETHFLLFLTSTTKQKREKQEFLLTSNLVICCHCLKEARLNALLTSFEVGSPKLFGLTFLAFFFVPSPFT